MSASKYYLKKKVLAYCLRGQWMALTLLLHNLEIQGENYASKYGFLRRVEIEQKPTALLALMLLQPWMQQ